MSICGDSLVAGKVEARQSEPAEKRRTVHGHAQHDDDTKLATVSVQYLQGKANGSFRFSSISIVRVSVVLARLR